MRSQVDSKDMFMESCVQHGLSKSHKAIAANESTNKKACNKSTKCSRCFAANSGEMFSGASITHRPWYVANP
ncbi:unnamed protein product [Dovyalis caffra]|uniref:Uncharacterized protein n=1 Tax=Dovyalis caffra TaxID=77055 RepID=A0AAV1SJU9_9ROSI|nr:unnamed protein product [Dovyalis caffra]